MTTTSMQQFRAILDIIGINPFVFVPEPVLLGIFKQAGKEKGTIPVKGSVNGKDFIQTLVKYKAEWRLYINTMMLKDSPKRIEEEIDVIVCFDPADRSLLPHPDLVKALDKNPVAKAVFEGLAPSRRKEIVRYISFLKSEQSVAVNIDKAIGFLLGKNRFAGRDLP